jgi:hypothetical protein
MSDAQWERVMKQEKIDPLMDRWRIIYKFDGKCPLCKTKVHDEVYANDCDSPHQGEAVEYGEQWLNCPKTLICPKDGINFSVHPAMELKKVKTYRAKGYKGD